MTTWNMAAEWTALAFALVILQFARRSVQIPTLRDRLFHYGLLLTITAVASNLLSTYLIYAYKVVPVFLNMAAATLYYLITPLIAVVYFYYAVALLYYDREFGRIHFLWFIGLIPYSIYLLMVLLNSVTGAIFTISREAGYMRGPHNYSMYLVFYVYSLTVVFLTFLQRKKAGGTVIRALMIFPILALAVIAIQALHKTLVLSGTAAVLSLLIVYFFLQSQRSIMDTLTGLLNRSTLLHLMQTSVKGGRPFVLMEISLNGFKSVNDHFGQEQGDLFLKQIAGELVKISGKSNVYRFMGDQFVVMLGGETRAALPGQLDAVLRRFRQPWQAGDVDYYFCANIGIVSCPEVSTDVNTLLAAMEDAVNRGASQGGSCGVCHYKKEMLSSLYRKEHIQDLMRESLKNGGDAFEVVYQPIWSISEKCFTQAEALLRMTGGDLGPLYPDEFIPIAEESGLIVDITYLVLDRVSAFLAALPPCPQGQPLLKCVSVNFSALEFF